MPSQHLFRAFLRTVLAGLLLGALAATAGQAQDRAPALTIVHVASLPNIVPIDGSNRPDMRLRGGMARVVGVIDAIKGERRNVLVTHGGGALSPSPFSLIDGGAHMIDVLNRVGFDVMAVGARDFNFGPYVLEQRIAEAKFPVLASNARHRAGAALAGTRPTAVFTIGDVTVALVGAVTARTVTASRPGDVVFDDPVEKIAAEAALLRQAGVDLIVALAGLDEEENWRLLDAGGVDLVLGGFNERLTAARKGKTLLVEPDANGATVAVVDVYVDRLQREVVPENLPAFDPNVDLEKIRDDPESLFGQTHLETETALSFDVRFVDTINTEPEVFTEIVTQQYASRFYATMATPVGVTETELDVRRDVVRMRETGAGNLIADAMRAGAEAEVALISASTIRGNRVYPAHTPLTLGAIYTMLPFDVDVVVRELSGAQILAILQRAIDRKDRPAPQFLQVSGLTFACRSDLAVPRVASVRVGAAPLSPERRYRVALTDFLADGGDGYDMLLNTPEPAYAPKPERVSDVLAAYIRNQKQVAPKVEGRIDCR